MKAAHEFESQGKYLEYLRAFFSGKALQGYLASYAQEWWRDDDADKKHAAKMAVQYADALIDEISKSRPK